MNNEEKINQLDELNTRALAGGGERAVKRH